jgi:hypothetical protein
LGLFGSHWYFNVRKLFFEYNYYVHYTHSNDRMVIGAMTSMDQGDSFAGNPFEHRSKED